MSSYGYFDREDPPEPPPKKRRNARARYQLTPLGDMTLNNYQGQVATAQSGDGGREALEATQALWASSNKLETQDALLLDELRQKPQTVLELTRSLDTCGIKRPTVEGGVERLVTYGFIEPVASSS